MKSDQFVAERRARLRELQQPCPPVPRRRWADPPIDREDGGGTVVLFLALLLLGLALLLAGGWGAGGIVAAVERLAGAR